MRRSLLDEIRLAPGQEWSSANAAWRFVLVRCGEAYWLGEPRARALTAGECLAVAPGVKAVVRASELNEVLLRAFSFAPELLAQLFSMDPRRFLEAEGSPAGQTRFLPTTHPAARRFAALATDARKTGRLGQRAEVLRIVADVFDQTSERHPFSPPGACAQLRFEELVAQMPDTEIIHHTAAQLAELCGCTARHLNRLFRKRFGVPVRTRQTELRLLKARGLLSDTSGRIQDVAVASGYRNLSLFNSLFKRRFGMSPSEWRQSLRPPGDSSPAPKGFE